MPKHQIKNIFSLIIIISVWSNVKSTDPIVKTKHSGTYIGETRDYYDAFEGIRYAKPPIGDLRFEPPIPVDADPDKQYIVKSPGPFCLQWNLLKFEGDLLDGDEDCLYLNIYVPHVEDKTKKLPVIFHIHGGAFKFGSGTLYGPNYLTKKGMILVNMQYRLGVLGFLSSGDALVPGNMGFKDQSLALKWVHNNIGAFGGDPNQILLTGWSSGAAAAHAHMFSPLSRGLFVAGVSHSGTATSHRMLSENVTDKFDYVVNGMGCKKEDRNEILVCLKSKNGGDLIRKTIEMYTFLSFPGVNFAMVVEPPSNHAFMIDTPLNLLKRGEYDDIPWTATLTEDDGLWFTAAFIRNNSTKILEEINERWNEVAPLMLDYDWIESKEKQMEISKKIRKHYFGDQPINRDTLKSLTKVFTDRFFRHGVAVAAQYQEKLAVYNFNFPVTYGFASSLSKLEDANTLGLCHGDDILLIYDNAIRKNKPFNAVEQRISDGFMEIYKGQATSTLRLDYALSKEKGSMYYRNVSGANYVEDFTVPFDEFGDLGFWKSLDINDRL